MTIKVVHHHIFLKHRCTQLEATNKKQAKKRETKYKFTNQKGIFGGLEGGEDDVAFEDQDRSKEISLLEVPAKPVIEPTLSSMPLIRRQMTYSGCGIKGHIYSQCRSNLLNSNRFFSTKTPLK